MKVCQSLAFCCGVLLQLSSPAVWAADNVGASWSQDLNTGNVPAAVQRVSSQYGLGGGRAADATLLFTIINTTSIDFGARTSGTPVNQPVYAKAFGQFIHQLQRDNQPVAEAFANIIASSFMDPYGSPYGYTTDYTGALLELAEAAGSDQSFVGAFQQYQKVLPDVREAQAHLEKIENHGGPLPSNYSLTPSTIAALRAAAATVYGANSVTISQHKGNTSALAALFFASAYLAQGDLSAAANNLSETVASAALPSSQQQQAYTKAIQHSLEMGLAAGSPSISAVTVLVAAVLQAKLAASLTDSFAQANRVPLQVFCSLAQGAQNLSTTTGQAVLAAIPTSFGSQPCNFLQGHGDFLYQEYGGTVRCNSAPPSPAGAPTSDCSRATAQLQANSSQCVVPRKNPLFYSNEQVYVSVAGNCSIVFGGPAGSALTCSKVAKYAQEIATACRNSQQTTGGSYQYPEGRSTQGTQGYRYINVVPPNPNSVAADPNL